MWRGLFRRVSPRAASVARPRPSLLLSPSSRAYITGARHDFEHDFEVENSAQRRKQLRAFFAALAPDEASALATERELEQVMLPHTHGGHNVRRDDR